MIKSCRCNLCAAPTTRTAAMNRNWKRQPVRRFGAMGKCNASQEHRGDAATARARRKWGVNITHAKRFGYYVGCYGLTMDNLAHRTPGWLLAERDRYGMGDVRAVLGRAADRFFHYGPGANRWPGDSRPE